MQYYAILLSLFTTTGKSHITCVYIYIYIIHIHISTRNMYIYIYHTYTYFLIWGYHGGIIIWLVVCFTPWKIGKSIGMIIPNIWKNKKRSKLPTRDQNPLISYSQLIFWGRVTIFDGLLGGNSWEGSYWEGVALRIPMKHYRF